MFTEVAPDLIRIFSARNATSHERRDHEEAPSWRDCLQFPESRRPPASGACRIAG